MPPSDSSRHDSPRRRAIRLLGALGWLAAAGPLPAQPKLAPTPRDAEGPYFPRSFPDDVDADLTRIRGRSGTARGTPLRLSGRVLTSGGAPLAGAAIELWQCDAWGTYHHVGETGRLDPDFQGYGRTTTDAQGRYAFRTIRPVPYGGRPAHLHFKLAHPRAAALTTQLYLRGESTERSFGGMFARERERLEIAPKPASDEVNALDAAYDFVLVPIGE